MDEGPSADCTDKIVIPVGEQRPAAAGALVLRLHSLSFLGLMLAIEQRQRRDEVWMERRFLYAGRVEVSQATLITWPDSKIRQYPAFPEEERA